MALMQPRQTLFSFGRAAALAAVLLGASTAFAFPTWMGVGNGEPRHNGNNPGLFTSWLNQDYWGLHAEVVVRVDGGSWQAHAMTNAGNVDGNSVWRAHLPEPWPVGSTIDYYFHGWDDWGGNIWDSQEGQNYRFVAAAPWRIDWVGNTHPWPPTGEIEAGQSVWVNTETWRLDAARRGRVLFKQAGAATWSELPLQPNGNIGNNDAWHADLGGFPANTTLLYLIEMEDWSGNRVSDDNQGRMFHALVAPDPLADADADGMPNAWEDEHSFDPLDALDAGRDADGDGLTNEQEFVHGTDPLQKDTDADLVDDGVELLATLTDPVSPDAHELAQTVTLAGADIVSSVGAWTPRDGEILADGARGTLEYAFNLPRADVYSLSIAGGHRFPVADRLHRSPVDVFIDGVYVARLTLETRNDETARVRSMTPFLGAGPHRLLLLWDNAWKHNHLRVSALRFDSLFGPDANANGRKDWTERWLQRRNGTEPAASGASAKYGLTRLAGPEELQGPISRSAVALVSDVSPAYIEGRAAYADLMHSRTHGAVFGQAPGNRFYANVPLSDRRAVPFDVHFENGALRERFQIGWSATNVLTRQSITLREGDGLRLTAGDTGWRGTGRVRIRVSGDPQVYDTRSDEAIVYRFRRAGTYRVEGTLQRGHAERSGTMTVRVVAPPTLDSPVVALGRFREWRVPELPAGAVLQTGPDVSLGTRWTDGGGILGLDLGAAVATPQPVVVRLGTSGPVLAEQAVRGMRVFAGADTYNEVVDRLPEDTQVVETALILSPPVDDVTVRVRVIASGILFEDGTLEKEFTAADLDSLGTRTLRFLRPATTTTSNCHSIGVLQDGTPLL